MVCRWGAYPGPAEKLRKADERNARGYWEYTPIWDFLIELGVTAEGASWWDASFLQRTREKLSLPEYRDKALALIDAMERGNRPWVWKDPALVFFLSFWKCIWGDAAYVILVRNPHDIALSWLKFARLEGSKSSITGNLLRWQYMMTEILEHTEESGRKVFIPYEGLVQNPLEQANRLGAVLDRDCGPKASDDTRIRMMAEAVDPRLWRNRNHMPFDQFPEATEEHKALQKLLEKKVIDPREPFEIGNYVMPEGWQKVVENKDGSEE